MISVTKTEQYVDTASLTSNVEAEIVNTTENMESLIEIGNMKVCRVCLAMSVKMYHVWEHQLSVMYERVTGFEINTEDDLPKMLCWECVARLSSAHNFLEKASKTHWFLMKKLKCTKNVIISEIESIDRAQHRLKSTLGFKYFNENYSDFNFVEESDTVYEHQFKRESYDYSEDRKVEDCELNDIGLNIVGESNITTEVNITNEKNPIKKEYLDTNEEQSLACEEYIGPLISIEKHELKFQNLDTQNYDSIKERNNGGSVMSNEESQIFDEARELCEDVKYCQRNWSSSDALPNCKELREVVEDIILTSSEHNTQDPLSELGDTAGPSNEYRTVCLPPIKRDIEVEKNNFVQKMTLNKNTTKGKYIQSPLENKNVCDPVNADIISTVTTGIVDAVEDVTKSLKNVFICDICGRQFQLKTTLKQHIKKHPKMYSCTYCSYKTAKKYTLNYHVNAKHTKTEVYNCSHCSYKSCRKDHLTRHVNAKHTKINVYDCNYCSYKAYYKSYLTAHVNAKHTKTKVHNCSHCNYQSYRKDILAAHVTAKHTNKSVHDCTYCSYKAYNKGHLISHVNAKHTKTDVYNCSSCNYKTYNKRSLVKHVNAIHTKTNVYNCSFCSYKAYDRSTLTKHVNAKHT